MKIKNKMKKQLMGLLSLVMVFSLTSQNILYAMGENENEPTPAYTNEYSDENVKIDIHADGGVLPENAVLKVTPIEKKEINDEMDAVTKAETEKINALHDQTNEKLKSDDEENETSLEGFLAYDISFMVDGKEVEPNGNVDVSIQFIKATKPEGVSDDSVVNVKHFKEVKGQTEIEDITEKSDITTTENAAVEKIALQSNSFSVFTIVWKRTEGNPNSGIGTQELAIKVVDQKGNEINAGQDYEFDFTSNNEVDIKVIASKLKENAKGSLNNYYFTNNAYVKLANKTGYTYFNKLVKWETQGSTGTKTGGFQAKVGDIQYNINDWKNENGKKYAYFVFDSVNEINTIDSTEKGVNVKMINYPAQQFEGGLWKGNHNIKQGILKNTLNSDGYPSFNKDNKWDTPREGSLKTYFKDATKANHLFLESSYNDKGHYFYYNSAENSASYDQASGNFKVYDALVTPSNENVFYYKRGNFLPYNTIKNTIISSNTNQYDEFGNRLDENDPNYGKSLLLPDQKTDYFFGMELEANFIQAENGIYDGNPMRYEFTGDDDLWVYIDGVLVLDLGGCHDARSGYIDFSTGKVSYQKTENSYETKDLVEIFKKANKYNASDWKIVNGHEVFEDYSSHEMKMWYMERGQGASNLKIKFNLPVIPKGQIQVMKQLEQETNPLVYGNVDFGFKLYLETSAGSGKYQQVTNTSEFDAKKISSNGVDTSDLEMNQDGIFYLKPKEMATFSGIEENRKYYVEEVDVKSDEFDQVFVNNTSVTDYYDDQSSNTTYTATSSKETVVKRPQVTFKNSCSAKNKRTLSIEKKMKEGQTSSDSFKVLVEIENENGELVPFNGQATLFNGSSDDNGQILNIKDGYIYLKAGQKACIYNILSDTKFKVTEDKPNDDYGVIKYSVNGADKINKNNGASGAIKLGTDATVTIENRLASIGTLEFTKVDEATQKGLQYATFGLYSEQGCSEGSLISQSVSDENGKVNFDISKLYNAEKVYLKEISAPFGYKLDNTIYTVTITKTDDDGTKVITGKINGGIKTISNMATETGGKTNVTVKKDWSNIPESQWEDVTVTLFGNGTQVGNSVILNSESKWQYTWSNLPGDIKYTVEEKNPNGFVVSYDKESSIVVDDNFTSITPNNETYFELGSNGVIAIFSNANWYIWTTSELDSAQKQAMITQLDDAIHQGSEISTKNTEFGSGNTSYTFKKDTKITFKYENGKLKLDFGNPKAWSFFFMGNYTENVTLKVKNDIDTNKKTSIPVEKVWEDNDSPNRPTSVEVQLYKEVNGETTKVDGKTLTLKEANDWKGMFENLPYWDTVTKTKINYKVKESKIGDINIVEDNDVVNGYTHTVIQKDGKFIIINYLNVGSLRIDKQIVESDIKPNDGDPIFTFRIENEDRSIVLYRTIRLSDAVDHGSILINDLPLGKYTVTELDTMRYTCVNTNPKTVEVTKDDTNVSFENKITYDENFSHTDVVENSFKIDQDGTVTVTKQVVPGTDLATSKFDAKRFLNQLLEGALASLN